jgi:hypothetical protein
MISTGFLQKAGVVIPVRTVAYSHRSTDLATSAPTIVPDLAVKAITYDSAELTRSVPGHNSFKAQASQHIVGNAAFGIAATKWQEVARCGGEPLPIPAGQEEVFMVSGLTDFTRCYLAVRVTDEAPNWSGLPNVTGYGTVLKDSPLPVMDSQHAHFPYPRTLLTPIID